MLFSLFRTALSLIQLIFTFSIRYQKIELYEVFWSNFPDYSRFNLRKSRIFRDFRPSKTIHKKPSNNPVEVFIIIKPTYKNHKPTRIAPETYFGVTAPPSSQFPNNEKKRRHTNKTMQRKPTDTQTTILKANPLSVSSGSENVWP